MMSTDLLDQFRAHECTPHVKRLLAAAIADQALARPRFEFNLFEVTIDRDQSMVILEDVLESTERGVQRIPLEEFASALGLFSAP